jgi:hypothetical protein
VAVKTPRTYLLVAVIAANHDLRTGVHALAGFVDADVHGRFATTSANRLDLFDVFGERQQLG